MQHSLCTGTGRWDLATKRAATADRIATYTLKHAMTDESELSKLGHVDLRRQTKIDLSILRDARQDLKAGDITPQLYGDLKKAVEASVGERARRHGVAREWMRIVTRNRQESKMYKEQAQRLAAYPGEEAASTSMAAAHAREAEHLLKTQVLPARETSKGTMTAKQALNRARQRLGFERQP